MPVGFSSETKTVPSERSAGVVAETGFICGKVAEVVLPAM